MTPNSPNGRSTLKDRELMTISCIRFKGSLHSLKKLQDKTFHQVPFVSHTSLLDSLLILWCSKTFNSSFLCSSIVFKRVWSSILFETWSKISILVKLQTCSSVIIARKQKRLRKTFTLFHCKLRIQRTYLILSIDMLWAKWLTITNAIFVNKKPTYQRWPASPSCPKCS